MAASAADVLDGASGDPQLFGNMSENNNDNDVIMVINLQDEPESRLEPLLDQSLVCLDEAATTLDEKSSESFNDLPSVDSQNDSSVESSESEEKLCHESTSGSSYDETGMDHHDNDAHAPQADHEILCGTLMLRSVDGTWTSLRFIGSGGGDSGCEDDPGSESVDAENATDTPANDPAAYQTITNGMLMLRSIDGTWTAFRFIGRTP